MKIKDLLWSSVLILFSLIFVFDTSRTLFEEYTMNYPYLMGFIKTAILATMGELLAFRIVTGKYSGIKGIGYRFLVWGFLGMCFVLVFKIFAGGVIASQNDFLLPKLTGFGGNLLFAFFTSLFMNLIFAPTFMALHRITDTYIDLANGSLRKIKDVKIEQVINKIDWQNFIRFVVLKTIPLFWIPMHTITFLLPPQYRVLMAASLSIALGIILSLSKKMKMKASC